MCVCAHLSLLSHNEPLASGSRFTGTTGNIFCDRRGGDLVGEWVGLCPCSKYVFTHAVPSLAPCSRPYVMWGQVSLGRGAMGMIVINPSLCLPYCFHTDCVGRRPGDG